MADDWMPLDNIFPNLGNGFEDDGIYSIDLDYDARVRAMIDDARDYQDSVLAPAREDDERLFRGLEPALDEDGRSTIVATEVRDTIMAIMPSLMRIFTSDEKVVEYVPNRESEVDMAEQATDYANYVFWEDNPGFMIMVDILKDSCVKKTAAVKWWTDDTPEVFEKQFENLSIEQYQYLMYTNPEAEVIDEMWSQDAQGIQTVDIAIRTRVSKPMTYVESIPPDELRIDRNAKSVNKFSLLGQERLMPPGELIAMGFPRELVEQYMNSGAGRFNDERAMRNAGLEMESSGRDTRDGLVLFGQYYIRIDQDNDGIAELRHITTMGDADEIVEDVPVDRVKMALFTPDPEPHTAIGHSISEYIRDLQIIKTNVLRSTLDSLAQSIFPRTVINENLVNMDDALSTDLGQTIRTKGDVANTVAQLPSQFVGRDGFDMMAYLDKLRETRTGVSEASKGLDPKALQSTAVKGVDMIITGAQERIELIALILSHTGMKDMFKGLLQEITENPNRERTIRLRGKWVEVRPDQFDPTMSVHVNKAIGRGSDMDRMILLNSVKATQEIAIKEYGPDNDLCSVAEYRNTLQDILEIGNMRNVGRYFKPIDMDAIRQRIAQTPPPEDPALILAKNEQEKVRANTVKQINDSNLKREKLQVDDDFRRDKLVVDTLVTSATNQTAIDNTVIKDAIAAARDITMGNLELSNGPVGTPGPSETSLQPDPASLAARSSGVPRIPLPAGA